MKTTAVVSTFGKITFAGAFALLSISQAVAEDRVDVLERIAPIGKVVVEGKTAPTPVVEQTPAPVAAAEAVSEAAESAPVAEAEAAVTEAAAEVEAAATEAVEEVAAAAGSVDAMSIATSSGCMGCHQIEAKVVGPAYKEVAAKYKDDAGALDMLSTKVKAGGVGTWGQIPMPPNAHVSDENIRTIVEWVLTL